MPFRALNNDVLQACLRGYVGLQAQKNGLESFCATGCLSNLALCFPQQIPFSVVHQFWFCTQHGDWFVKQSLVDPPAGRKMQAVALTHFSFRSLGESTVLAHGHLTQASENHVKSRNNTTVTTLSGRHGGEKKKFPAYWALDHNRRTAVGAKSWAVAAMISYDQLWQKGREACHNN